MHSGHFIVSRKVNGIDPLPRHYHRSWHRRVDCCLVIAAPWIQSVCRASSVMRRLRRRVREAEKEKLTKLYEQLSANEHRSALPFGQAHSIATHEAASSGERKNVGRELSADEQIGQAHSFATHEATSSEEQKNAGRELFADGQIGQAHSFATHEAAPSGEQKNVAGESVKKDVVALRMAEIMRKIDEIFDDGRRAVVEKVRHIRES